MATRIRLKRLGSKHEPHYRIAVMDQRSPRDGRAVEEIGYYNPGTDPATVEIKADRAAYWLSVGAQPSDTVSKLFAKAGVGAAAAEDAPAEAAATEETAETEEPAEAEES